MTVKQEIIIAGFGGQGVLSAGRIVAYAGMLEGRNVSWLPSYGPEMRGGTANCHVVISDEPVGSPVLNSATTLVAMNSPSLEKFENIVVPGGIIIIDNSLISKSPKRKDIELCGVPAAQIASEMGNLAYANVVLLGKLIEKTRIISKESFISALKHILPEKKHYMLPEEIRALELGMAYECK